MRYVLPAVAALATIAVATPSAADWSFTRWGMTPAQVVRASGGTAQLHDMPANPGQTYIVRAIGTVRSGDLTFGAHYRFENDRLVVVSLYLRQGTCIGVLSGLEDKYGRRTPSQFVAGYNWTSQADNVRVEFEGSGTECNVSYRPLRGRNSAGL